MAKQGMKRPEITKNKQMDSVPPVPEIQGKAKTGKIPARPIVSGTASPAQKVYHTVPHMDNDLARDNLKNHIPEADLRNC